MPKLTLEVPHSLGQAEAITRIRNYLNNMEEEQPEFHAEDESWNGNRVTYTFRAQRFSTEVSLIIEEDVVEFAGELPLTAMLFRGPIENAIREQLRRALVE